MLLLALCCRSAQRRAAVADPPDRRVLSLLRTPGMARGLVVSSAVIVAMDITLVYLPALGAEKGWTVGTVGALLAARSVARMASGLAAGALTRRLGRRRLLAITIGASAVATATVPLPVPLWLVAVAVLVMGFGLGVCMPATLARLAEIAPRGLQGRVVALRLVGNRFGQVVIRGGVGLVAAGLGAAGVLWLTAVLLAGGLPPRRARSRWTARRDAPLDSDRARSQFHAVPRPSRALNSHPMVFHGRRSVIIRPTAAYVIAKTAS